MDRRRAIGCLLALGNGVVVSFAQAQQPGKLRRVAFLAPGTEGALAPFIETFRGQLKEFGYTEGRNLSMDVRWSGDDPSKWKAIAADIVRRNPEVIVTASSAGVIACKAATSSIPIVFASAGEVVEQGFVASLQRPGRNVTGLMVDVDANSKLVELVRDTLPQTRRLAVLVYDKDPISKRNEELFDSGVQRYNITPLVVNVSSPEEFGRAFDEMVKQKADAVLIPPLQMFGNNRDQLAQHALRTRVPAFCYGLLTAQAAGIIGYGADGAEGYRRAASFVDRILRGANPAELPIERLDRFLLIVNLKMARAIGVTVPRLMIMRADTVIE